MLDTVGKVDASVLAVIEELIDQCVLGSALACETSLSTNSDALSQLREQKFGDGMLPRLYFADVQTGGRGRQGNHWVSPNDALTFSLVLAQDSINEPTARLLSLAVGVATARAIEFVYAPVKCRLKWPNDVYVAGGKVAGILIETSQAFTDRIVIGIGVNVIESPTLESPDTTAMPQSLFAATGRRLSRHEVLEVIIRELVAVCEERLEAPQSILHQFRERCMLTGNQISFLESGRESQGLCRGISDNGSLMIQTPAGLRYCDSGAIRLVRLRG
ncbi:Bifunctional ligase/repressor BirA [Novipirellula aureliae]|uniref:Bifunctional ligase/repressor BirA n=1 Tax=Novipirellula aureliae TaxID=2527966 RepID=A0A5C6E5D9_9BACT|nr:biotin--[acetyl-CoA-carboxylase] ligase [Novipirellula aureliae]TWU44068.1 Bifunctional ligase/repressor BirA [Novipirellula aureliae]